MADEAKKTIMRSTVESQQQQTIESNNKAVHVEEKQQREHSPALPQRRPGVRCDEDDVPDSKFFEDEYDDEDGDEDWDEASSSSYYPYNSDGSSYGDDRVDVAPACALGDDCPDPEESGKTRDDEMDNVRKDSDDDDEYSIMTPGGSSLKACPHCTLLNAADAKRCEACEVPFFGGPQPPLRQAVPAVVVDVAATAASHAATWDEELAQGLLWVDEEEEEEEEQGTIQGTRKLAVRVVAAGDDDRDRHGHGKTILLERARAIAESIQRTVADCLKECESPKWRSVPPSSTKVERAGVRPLPTLDLVLHVASLLECVDQTQALPPSQTSGARTSLRLYGVLLDEPCNTFASIRLEGLPRVAYSFMFESVEPFFISMANLKNWMGWFIIREPRSGRAFPLLAFDTDASSQPAVERIFSRLAPLVEEAVPPVDMAGTAPPTSQPSPPPGSEGCDVLLFVASANRRDKQIKLGRSASMASEPEDCVPPPRPEPLPELYKPPPIACSPMWSPEQTQYETKAPPFNSDVPSIAFLTSDPLICRTDTGEACPVQHRTDANAERKDLIHCINRAALKVNFFADTATPQSLRAAAIDARYRILHFSGLAHEAKLALEDEGRGGPLWLDWSGLVHLLKPPPYGAARPLLAIVMTQCATQVGRMFLAAGFKHVVCCEKSDETTLELPLNFDRIARVFTYALYSSLLSGATLTTAYHHGCKTVRLLPGLGDVDDAMARFRLLPDDIDHRIPIFDVPAQPLRDATTGIGAGGLRQTNKLHEFLSPRFPNRFLGREGDVFNLLQLVLNKRSRVVSVTGPSGMGKSALVHGLCHYLNDRASTTRVHGIDRIFCFNLAPQFLSFVSRLRDLLIRERICPESVGSRTIIQTQSVDHLVSLCGDLSGAKALLILDDADQWSATQEGLTLDVLIQSLVAKSHHVSIVCTSVRAVLAPPTVSVCEYPISGLRSSDATRLFVLSSTCTSTVSERHALYSSVALSLDGATGERDSSHSAKLPREVLSAIEVGIPSQIVAEAGRSTAISSKYSLAGGRFDDGHEARTSSPMMDILHPHPHDVVLGAEEDAHIGNSNWRALIQDNRKLFKSLPECQKELLSQSIVTAIRSQIPPGRFLKRNAETGLWFDVGDLQAKELTSMSLMKVMYPNVATDDIPSSSSSCSIEVELL